MSEIKNKVEWCLRKAEKEILEKGKHRGLIRIEPSKEKAKTYIQKAEHYLEATLLLRERFSDISASTSFYAIYHGMLAIATKFGYETRNQECTFALMYMFIEEGKIDLNKGDIDKIAQLNGGNDESVIETREYYQYGTDLSMKEELYKETFEFAKLFLGKVKKIIEG